MEYFLNSLDWIGLDHTHVVKSPQRAFVKKGKTWKVILWTFFLSHSSGPIRFVIASLCFVSVRHATLAANDLARQCIKQSSSQSRSVEKLRKALSAVFYSFYVEKLSSSDKNGAIAASKQIHLAADVVYNLKKLLFFCFSRNSWSSHFLLLYIPPRYL